MLLVLGFTKFLLLQFHEIEAQCKFQRHKLVLVIFFLNTNYCYLVATFFLKKDDFYPDTKGSVLEIPRISFCCWVKELGKYGKT